MTPEQWSWQNGTVKILATSVFERIVYHCALLDGADPARPTLVLDAVVREGDADGPLLVAVADFKRMVGFDQTRAALLALRAAGRTEAHDGVEYVTFPMWATPD
jgi:hypothetical protein